MDDPLASRYMAARVNQRDSAALPGRSGRSHRVVRGGYCSRLAARSALPRKLRESCMVVCCQRGTARYLRHRSRHGALLRPRSMTVSGGRLALCIGRDEFTSPCPTRGCVAWSPRGCSVFSDHLPDMRDWVVGQSRRPCRTARDQSPPTM